MTTRFRLLATALVMAVGTISQSGCFWLTAQGPNIGPLAIPIPVPRRSAPACTRWTA